MIKIRSEDYEKLNAKAENDFLETSKLNYIRFYSLEVAGNKLFEKNHLEEL